MEIILYYLFKRDFLNKFKFNKIILYFILIFSLHYIFLAKPLEFTLYPDTVRYYATNNALPSFLIVLSFLLIEQNYGVFKSKSLLLLGNASFSIYLSHYIVIHTIHKYYDKNFSMYYLFIISIVIGVLVYKSIEVPLNKYIKKRLKTNV